MGAPSALASAKVDVAPVLYVWGKYPGLVVKQLKNNREQRVLPVFPRIDAARSSAGNEE